MEDTNKIVAITSEDQSRYGCPYCSFDKYAVFQKGAGQRVCLCGACQKRYVVADDSSVRITFSFGETGYYPELIKHPKSISSIYKEEESRPVYGEYFTPNGIVHDWIKGCFVCNTGKEMLRPTLVGYVKSKEAGQRVVYMHYLGFKYNEIRGGELHEVEIGVCDHHLRCLEALKILVEDGVINRQRIDDIVKLEKEGKLSHTSIPPPPTPSVEYYKERERSW